MLSVPFDSAGSVRMHGRLYHSLLHFSWLKYLRRTAPRSARPVIADP